MNKIGRIYKILSKFYYVKEKDKIYECMAKGKFKNIGTNLCVGDIVEFEIDKFNESKGNIVKVHDRKNCIIRPTVSNIDKLIITFLGGNNTPELRIAARTRSPASLTSEDR